MGPQGARVSPQNTAFVAVVATSLVSSGVQAEERAPPRWQLDVKAAYVVLGDRSAWGWCLRYLGFFPALEAGAAYRPTQHVALVASCGIRIVQAPTWSGASVEPAAAGRISW